MNMFGRAEPAPAILIAGHSHTNALGPYFRPGQDARLQQLRERVRGRGAVFGLSHGLGVAAELAALIGEHAARRHVVLLWEGNDHYARFFFVGDRPFDFVSSKMPGLPIAPGAALVPEALVEACFSRSAAALNLALAILREKSTEGITVACTPPPKRDDEFLRARLAAEFGPILKKYGDDPATIAFAPAYVRLKVWDLLMCLNQRVARKHGAAFLPLPQGCQDEWGFLRREFWANDVTHANSNYGKLLLEHIVAGTAPLCRAA